MKTRDTLFVLILTALAMAVTVACSGDRTGDATTDTSRSESTDDVVVSDSLTVKAKPAAAKGTYLKSCTVTSTMGPGVPVATAKYGV